MSETITLGRIRKTGEWKVLVAPDKQFGEHDSAYRKIANVSPVNEEFTDVIVGRVQRVLPPLKLITSDEKKAKDELEKNRLVSLNDIVASAEKRQAESGAKIAAAQAKTHAEALAEKNAVVASIVKETAPVKK